MCFRMITRMAGGDNSRGREAREKLFQQYNEERVRVWDGGRRLENFRYTSLLQLATVDRNFNQIIRTWGLRDKQSKSNLKFLMAK